MNPELTPPFTPGQKLHCRIEAMGFGGSGIAKPGNFTVFVPKTAPGDEVWVEFTDVRRRFAFANPTEWTARAPGRIAAPCPHFSTCGGCHLQHFAAADVRALKQRQLEETFQKIARRQPQALHGIYYPDHDFYYRNKTTYHVRPDGTAGYIAIDGNTLVEVEQCPISAPVLNQAWKKLRPRLPTLTGSRLRYVTLRATTTQEVAVIFTLEAPSSDKAVAEIRELVANETFYAYVAPVPPGHFATFDRELITIRGPANLTETLAGIDYLPAPMDFFQIHPAVAARMIELTLRWQERVGSKRILDLYCGVGLFSLPLAREGAHTLGVELARSSILAAERSAARNGLAERATFRTGKAGTLAERLYREGHRFDGAVLDPPRKGVDAEVLAALAKLGVRNVQYVSCSPATFTRDWLALEKEGFTLREVHPLDMFPQTYHTELVAHFDR